MTKEQFTKIAEEEGIVSSDWKEQLWLAHQTAIGGLCPNHQEEREWVRVVIRRNKEEARQAYFTHFNPRYPRNEK